MNKPRSALPPCAVPYAGLVGFWLGLYPSKGKQAAHSLSGHAIHDDFLLKQGNRMQSSVAQILHALIYGVGYSRD